MRKNKHRNCLQLLFLLIFAAFVEAGCTKENMSECEISHRFTLRSSYLEDDDITDNMVAVKEIGLYVFDKAKKYLGIHNAKVDKVVELNHLAFERLNIVAWVNLRGGNQPLLAFNIVDHLETAFVSSHKTKASLPITQSFP